MVAVRDSEPELSGKVLVRLRVRRRDFSGNARRARIVWARLRFAGSGGGWPSCRWQTFLRKLLFQRQQFGDRHRQDRPVQFRQQSLVVAAAELGAVERLLQAAKFDFDSPPHLVEAARSVGLVSRAASRTLVSIHILVLPRRTRTNRNRKRRLLGLHGCVFGQHSTSRSLPPSGRSHRACSVSRLTLAPTRTRKCRPALRAGDPQRVADEARIAAKQRVFRGIFRRRSCP